MANNKVLMRAAYVIGGCCVIVFLFFALVGVQFDWESNDRSLNSRIQGQISGVSDVDEGNQQKSAEKVKAEAVAEGFYPDMYYKAYLIGYEDERKRLKKD